MFDIGMAEMMIVGGVAILLLGELDPICTYLLVQQTIIRTSSVFLYFCHHLENNESCSSVPAI